MTGGDRPIVYLELPADPGASRTAREALDEVAAGLRSADRVDLRVLVSELIAAVSCEGRSPVTLEVRRVPDGLEAEARGPEGIDPLDELSEALFERIASDWFVTGSTGGFRLAISHSLPGTLREEDLFVLADAGDRQARDELVDRYQGFARALARRFVKAQVKRDDLDQVALVGLVKALERFDLDRGVKFTTFAARTIEGELKRHLRDAGWSLRVPRGLQELGLEAGRVTAEIAQQEGREPTLDELADSLESDRSEVARALLARRSFDAASLDAPVGDEEALRLMDALPDHDPGLSRAAEWADLATVVEHLPVRERRILYLRFFEDLSQSEIAERVGVSQMHVSRLLARSLSELRAMIEGTSDGSSS